jgi:transposase-like protein
MSADEPRRESRRYSPPEKRDAVLRVLKGEKVGAVAGDIGVGVNRLERWQARFVAGGVTALQSRRAHQTTFYETLKAHGSGITQWAALLLLLTVLVFFLVRFLT